MIPELQSEVDKCYGFDNLVLAEKLREIKLDGLSDENILKIGLICAMSGDDDERSYLVEKGRECLKILSKKHDIASAFMMLKWVIQLAIEYKETVVQQIEEWSTRYHDEQAFSRIFVWTQRNATPSQLIAFYVDHLENFWSDHLSWYNLGNIYRSEKFIDRAIFCFEEAIALAPDESKYYVAAAEARLKQNKKDPYAVRQLSKALLLDPKNVEIVDKLIELKSKNHDKLVEYKKTLK